MNVLGDEVQLQVAADLRSRAAVAQATENGFLGLVQRHHQATVLPRQGQAPAFHIEFAQWLEQARLDLQVLAQLAIQARQALLYRLVGEQRVPGDREHPVPGRAKRQQQGFEPDLRDFSAALVDADHGVDGQDQRGRGDGRVALAQRAQQGHAEGRQGQSADEQPGIGEQQFHRQCGDEKAHQGGEQRLQAAEPVVVGFGQGAGDDAEEQRDHQGQLMQPPAGEHHPGQGDEYAQAVGELVQRPQAPEGLEHGGGGHARPELR
ncbi:MAG: hypothetical protein GAK43_02287 [Stenotrophomonas maltophilia]|nr:MAG: hypothetical protein GAK43_02287 [Stenotrophomonas maltophilia]